MTLDIQIVELAQKIGALLSDKNETITTAESCTGGGISRAITEVAGSSAYFNMSFVTYSNAAKQQLVNVRQETLLTFGAVSEQTVIEMSEGARKAANADYAVAVSGVAGPGGGSKEKPVGTVWIGIATESTTQAYIFSFDGDRHQVRELTVLNALILLEKYINSER